MRSTVIPGLLVTLLAGRAMGDNWYERSFYLLHEDHHTGSAHEVGRDADPNETARLVALSRPDVVQIHAKGNPGWTTYPTKIGHAPPKLRRDVLGVWRDLAAGGGYAFSVYYNIGRDGEIMKRRPAWNRVRADGKPYDRALCYHSGVAEAYLWPMIREIMDRYRPAGFWFDGSCFTVQLCYCDTCRRRFRRETKLDAPKGPSEKGWGRYHEMQRRVYRELIAKTAAMIHARDANCLVAFNWAYSLRMPETPPKGIDYLTGDIGDRVEGLSPEAHWYDSLDRPFDLMTKIHTRYPVGGSNRTRTAPKPREQVEQEMAVIVANGGRYFAWDNPTPTSGLAPDRMAFLARVVAPFLRARRAWCLGWRRAPDVSLLYSAAAHYAVTDARPASFSRRDNRIEGATDWLRRLHLNYEMISDDRLAAGDIRSGLLLVEHPKVLTPKACEHLAAWVKGGGKLLMTGMGVARTTLREEVFGIAAAEGPAGGEPLTVRLDGRPHRFEHWLFRLRPAKARTLLDVTDAKGRTHPLLTRHRCGKGTAYGVPIPLLSRHGRNVVPPALVRAVFEAILPAGKRLLATDAPESVEVVLRRKGGAFACHMVNLARGRIESLRVNRREYRRITRIPAVPASRVWLRLPRRPATVHVEPGGRRVTDWRYADGRLEVRAPGFAIHQVVVAEPPEP